MSNSQVRIKQWVTLAILTTVVITFAIIMAIFSQGREKQEKPTPATTINLDNHSFNEEHFVTTYGAKMSELEKEVANLQAQIKREEERKNREAKVKAREERFNDAFDSVEYESVGDITATSDNSNGFRPVSKKTQPIDGPRIVIKKVSDITTVDSTDNHKKDDIAKNRTREKKADDLLITGSFARARLLNGVEAPTGGQANGNPVPMLLEIKDPAFLPNRYRSDIKRCMVTANATGDLSSERVLVR